MAIGRIQEEQVRPRKRTGASRIEILFWFKNEDAWRRFSAVPIGRKTMTVSDREWDEEPVHHSERGYTKRLRFTHTCRNTGAHKSDTVRFINSTARAAGMSEDEMGELDIRLISRDESVSQVSLKEPPLRLGGGFYTDTRYNPDLL